MQEERLNAGSGFQGIPFWVRPFAELGSISTSIGFWWSAPGHISSTLDADVMIRWLGFLYSVGLVDFGFQNAKRKFLEGNDLCLSYEPAINILTNVNSEDDVSFSEGG